MNELNMLIVWLIVIVVFALAEGFTVQFINIWFAVGALAALIANAFGAVLWVQVLVFLIVSTLSLVLTRPFIKKVLKVNVTKTNADALIGESGIVIGEINAHNNTGLIRVKGQVWSAKSSDGSIIAEGEIVIVLEITGVKAVVKKINLEEIS